MDTNGNLFVCKIKIDLIFYHTNNINLTTNSINSIKMQSQNETQQEDQEMCAICLEGITRDYVLTKCGHQFHYACIRECDIANHSEYYTQEDMEEVFGNYSHYKEILDAEAEESPLTCPMCRSHLTPIRNGPILNKTNKMSSNKKHTEYIINEKSYTCMIYDEERRGHKFKSLKRHTNYKMIHRRYNK
jgi:hypothetical protein